GPRGRAQRVASAGGDWEGECRDRFPVRVRAPYVQHSELVLIFKQWPRKGQEISTLRPTSGRAAARRRRRSGSMRGGRRYRTQPERVCRKPLTRSNYSSET